jgi:hypothetical protein
MAGDPLAKAKRRGISYLRLGCVRGWLASGAPPPSIIGSRLLDSNAVRKTFA